MADSFMIRFLYEGKPCYANVYVYDTSPKEFHVHIVNSVLQGHLPDAMVLTPNNEKLSLHEPADIPDKLVKPIVGAIQAHLEK